MFGIRQRGWIGIDVGTSTVKVVQLAQSKKQLRMSGAAIMPRRNAWTNLSENEPLSSADELCAATSLHAGFHGKSAAATLPMALSNVHTLDRTTARQSEDERVVRQAIEMATQRSAENLQYDTWDAESEEEGQTSKKVNILSVPNGWTDQLFDDLTQTGWSCQTIDGLPLALARAVAMVDRCEASAPVAALDWGYTKATLCVVIDGRPVYVRCFKECGIERLLNSLCENLDVNEEEAQRLLQEHGIDNAASGAASSVGEVIKEIIAEPLTQLEREYRRTISHLQGQRRTIIPKKLYLLGGGATTKGIAAHLTSRLRTHVKVWQFGGPSCQSVGQPSLASCMFGPAVALSALAWE